MIGLGASAGGEAGRGSATALLLDRVRITAGEGAAAAGVALRFEENAAGGRGGVAGGRERRGRRMSGRRSGGGKERGERRKSILQRYNYRTDARYLTVWMI